MTAPDPELNPATGELWLTREAFAALASHATGAEPPSAASAAGHQLGLLRQAGVLDSYGQGHPAISDALRAVAEPAVATVGLSYAGKTMRGWVGNHEAALLLPPDGDDVRRRLMGLPRSWLPEGLSRLVDLSPRPRASPARSVPYEEGALNGVRRHWRLAFEWSPDGVAQNGGSQEAAQGKQQGAVLEVVDTEEGLWVLAPSGDGGLVANPSTPITVWRLIVRLVTRRDATARLKSS